MEARENSVSPRALFRNLSEGVQVARSEGVMVARRVHNVGRKMATAMATKASNVSTEFNINLKLIWFEIIAFAWILLRRMKHRSNKDKSN